MHCDFHALLPTRRLAGAQLQFVANAAAGKLAASQGDERRARFQVGDIATQHDGIGLRLRSGDIGRDRLDDGFAVTNFTDRAIGQQRTEAQRSLHGFGPIGGFGKAGQARGQIADLGVSFLQNTQLLDQCDGCGGEIFGGAGCGLHPIDDLGLRDRRAGGAQKLIANRIAGHVAHDQNLRTLSAGRPDERAAHRRSHSLGLEADTLRDIARKGGLDAAIAGDVQGVAPHAQTGLLEVDPALLEKRQLLQAEADAAEPDIYRWGATGQFHAVIDIQARETRLDHADDIATRLVGGNKTIDANAVVAANGAPLVAVGLVDQSGPVFDDANAHRIECGRYGLGGLGFVDGAAGENGVSTLELHVGPAIPASFQHNPGARGQVGLDPLAFSQDRDPTQHQDWNEAP